MSSGSMAAPARAVTGLPFAVPVTLQSRYPGSLSWPVTRARPLTHCTLPVWSGGTPSLLIFQTSSVSLAHRESAASRTVKVTVSP